MHTVSSVDPNVISLTCSQDSQISNVNLYSGHAEITRAFIVLIKAGQNHLQIHGLPRELQEDSFRVEGEGHATIHDVVISRHTPNSKTRPQLKYAHAGDPLRRELEEAKMGLESTKQTRLALHSYLQDINSKGVDLNVLEEMLDGYGNLARKIDGQILNNEREVAELEHQVKLQKSLDDDMMWRTSINVYGEAEKEVTLLLKYVVRNADWTPSYQIQADTRTNEKPIILNYKASITQRTYEPWENVPLTLETAKPTVGISAPRLSPWTLKIYNVRAMQAAQAPVIMHMASRSSSRSRSRSPRRYSAPTVIVRGRSRSPSPPPVIHHRPVHVSNKGNVVATFRVPGHVNVPSDEDNHNISIARLELDASLLWYTMPKVDTRVHIKAKIKNDSDYTFIPGQGKVYVDGSFISTTGIPPVSPKEVFDCSLGVDPSIRITYHPREKKAGQSGIYTKTTTEAFTQRITIHNTKSTAIQNLSVVDTIPVSEDQRIEVRLLNPALPMPTITNTAGLSGSILKTKIMKHNTAPKLNISANIIAQWEGTGDPQVDQTALGKNGMVSWLVSLGSQQRVTLILQYEVGFSEGLSGSVYGL